MKMVQVTSEAKASPIMTAFTRMSADRNIDHGDNSRGTCSVTGLAACTAPASAGGDDVWAAEGVTPEGCAGGGGLRWGGGRSRRLRGRLD